MDADANLAPATTPYQGTVLGFNWNLGGRFDPNISRVQDSSPAPIQSAFLGFGITDPSQSPVRKHVKKKNPPENEIKSEERYE